MSAVSEMLRAAGACTDSIAWASAYDDPTEAWAACVDIEWMLWWIDVCGDAPQRHLLIADLAEDALPIYERHVPGDTRVRDCIAARRAYARGEITQAQWGAAWEAARDAARAAARAAAWGAARAAASDAASDAAWGAASDAASDAAWGAAWGAARAAASDAAWGAGSNPVSNAAWQAARKRQRLIILQRYPTPPLRSV